MGADFSFREFANGSPEHLLLTGGAQVHPEKNITGLVDSRASADRPTMRISRLFVAPALMAFAGLVATPAVASADITAFFGVGHGPETRTAKGVAFGLSVVVVGFEIEYSDISAKDDAEALAPRLRTGTVNAIVQTPTAGAQLYGTVGVGGYRENLLGESETSTAFNIGGGLKLGLMGPLKLRIDYRLFTLRGDPVRATVHRVYAGLNAGF